MARSGSSRRDKSQLFATNRRERPWPSGVQPAAQHPQKRIAQEEFTNMCDYSLHLLASRPAKVGETLTATDFAKSISRGFAAAGEPEVAVCLLPGTELAFTSEVRYDRALSLFGKGRVDDKVARFRQINVNDPNVHHDALEFPDGQIVLVTRLVPGQRATVLQTPVPAQAKNAPAAAAAEDDHALVGR
jgi:hypothetical protein